MGSKADEYLANAREALDRAATASNPEIKRQFEDIARQWKKLAKDERDGE